MEWPPDVELVLLPGLDGTGLLFAPFIREIRAQTPARVSVIGYPPEQVLTVPELIAYTARRLPHGRPIAILAESFSGPIAVSLCANSAEIRGVIFCATFAQAPRSLLLNLAGILPRSLLVRLPLPDLAIRWLALGEHAPPSLIKLFRKALSGVKPEVLAQRIQELGAVNVLDGLDGLKKLSCLYIRGAEDRLVPARCLKPFQDALPSLTVKTIQGPHCIVQAKPGECLAAVAEFMSRLLPSHNELDVGSQSAGPV